MKLIDYFISRIKFYANGGKLDTSNAEEVTEKHIEQEVKEKSKQEVLPTGWKKNKHKTYYKAQKVHSLMVTNLFKHDMLVHSD